MTTIEQAAIGALAAQCAINAIAQGCTPSWAWLKLSELAAAHGWKSQAVAAFVNELAKRAARAQ